VCKEFEKAHWLTGEITESNDFDWTEEVEDIPVPNVGDKFDWGRNIWGTPKEITITDVDRDLETWGDIMIDFSYYNPATERIQTDGYRYKNWVSDWKDGLFEPIK
jgi:hypothetical protein